MQPHYYNVNIAWSKERLGVMCSPELANHQGLGNNCIEIATPPEFPKGMEGIWSPEHLFTASIASCFMTTFLAIAENSKLNFTSFTCKSRGKLDQVEGKFLMTEVELTPTVVLGDESEKERALRVLAKTENSCLISNSVKAKVIMNPDVRVSLKSVNV